MSFNESYKMNTLNEQRYFYRLAAIGTISRERYMRLSQMFGSLEELFNAKEEVLRNTGALTEIQIAGILARSRDKAMDEGFEDALQKGIKVIPYEDPLYPEMLKEIKDPPLCLFLKGKLPPRFAPNVSVIGARECSGYGESVARRLGELIGAAGISLISGMARGIDSVSQNAAVAAGGYSLAVLGGGVDMIYPKESTRLYRALEERGGIISEVIPGTPPLKHNFAKRNRLISGLSDAICIVEAKEKSGTLITVDCALDQGKDIYAIPGRISDITSFGTNELIRQGAGAISDLNGFVKEIQTKFGIVREFRQETKENKPQFDYSQEEMNIIRHMDENSFTIDSIGGICGIAPMEVLGRCIEFTEKGLLIPLGAGRFQATYKGLEIRNAIQAANY